MWSDLQLQLNNIIEKIVEFYKSILSTSGIYLIDLVKAITISVI